MPRETQGQKLARLERELEQSRIRSLDLMRERDDAKADAERIARELRAVSQAPADAKLLARLAAIMYPEDEPQTIHADDLANRAVEYETKERDQLRIARQMAELSGVDEGLSFDDGIMEELHEKMGEGMRAIDALDELPSEWKDWAEWVKYTELSPKSIDRMAELLELVGFSGTRLAYVLASTDMALSIKLS